MCRAASPLHLLVQQNFGIRRHVRFEFARRILHFDLDAVHQLHALLLGLDLFGVNSACDAMNDTRPLYTLPLYVSVVTRTFEPIFSFPRSVSLM